MPDCFLKRLKRFLDFFSTPEASVLGRGVEDAAVNLFWMALKALNEDDATVKLAPKD
jgi:hypothetical protein